MTSGEYRVEIRSPGKPYSHNKGVNVVANLMLRRGQKITVALGQKGTETSGFGGSFLTLETTDGPTPLLIAGGPGGDLMYDSEDEEKEFANGQLSQAGSGNDIPGSSGIQKYFENHTPNIYSAGAGFVTGPQVKNLDAGSRAPGSYAEGLVGGKTSSNFNPDDVGGFGGGGASNFSPDSDKIYYGAGGGFTGGAHLQTDDRLSRTPNGDWMIGGGGGSFSSVSNAVFTHHEEKDGKCKIELITTESIEQGEQLSPSQKVPPKKIDEFDECCYDAW